MANEQVEKLARIVDLDEPAKPGVYKIIDILPKRVGNVQQRRATVATPQNLCIKTSARLKPEPP